MTTKEEEGQFLLITEATKAIDILIKTVRGVIYATESEANVCRAKQGTAKVEYTRGTNVSHKRVRSEHTKCLS